MTICELCRRQEMKTKEEIRKEIEEQEKLIGTYSSVPTNIRQAHAMGFKTGLLWVLNG